MKEKKISSTIKKKIEIKRKIFVVYSFTDLVEKLFEREQFTKEKITKSI